MEQTDYQEIAKKLKLDLARYENERAILYHEHNKRVRGLEQVIVAIDEAIAFTSRWKDLLTIDPSSLQVIIEQRGRDMGKLNAYFRECKQRFESIMSDLPVEGLAERPVLDERSWINSGEGDKQRGSEQELPGDSGEVAPAMDSGRGVEERES